MIKKEESDCEEAEWGMKKKRKNPYKYFIIFMLIPHFLGLKGINKSYSRSKYLRLSNVRSGSQKTLASGDKFLSFT
jgi:hypothetical protein